MTAILDAHSAHFRKQAEWCDVLGSPFNAALLRGLAEGLGDGGPLDDLLLDGQAPLAPEAADAGPLRVAGALHALALSGEDPDLAAVYPAVGPDVSMETVLPLANAAFVAHRERVADFLTRPPQTNETRRSVALLQGFDAFCDAGPLHVLEVGASAGLNLNWDRFSYRGLVGDETVWALDGDPSGPLIDTDWQGPPPASDALPVVATRRGCDRSPIDLADAEARLRLRAYVWPDQAERLARLDAALELAQRYPVSVDEADVADWLERQLENDLPEGTTVIFHSIAWQYFDVESDARAKAALLRAGGRADKRRRLAWLRFEHGRVFGNGRSGTHFVDGLLWDGTSKNGQHTVFSTADPHARWVKSR